jgi:hypothetical protein
LASNRLYNCDMYFSYDCAAEGTDGESGYNKFRLLLIISLPPASQLHQYIVISCNNPAAHQADKFIRGWLAIVVRLSTGTRAFLPPNPPLPILKNNGSAPA